MVKPCGVGPSEERGSVGEKGFVEGGETFGERERCSRDGRNPKQDTSPVKIHMPCERKKPCEMERHS